MNTVWNFFINNINSFLGPLIVGLVIWLLGESSISRRLKNDAIRDLMTFRGDYSSSEFRRSLNKVSITFHEDSEIRTEVRHLYEVINNPSVKEKNIGRTIVGLIYKLCQKNGFTGLTKYDIDQAFPENLQEPEISLETKYADNKSALKPLVKTKKKTMS